MSPQCGNCEAFVSDQYVRVFLPEDAEQVLTCPNCDLKRTGGGETRELRLGGGE
jgi:hypothetical protein